MTSTPTGYAVESTALGERRESTRRSPARYALLALTIACIVALAGLKAAGTGSHLASDALGGVLAIAFIALTLVDFRASVAVTIFELVLGGAGGHWLDYGSLSGRIFLIVVVTLRAAWLTIADWREGLHPILGRYGAHGLALAVLIPAIWIPLGVVEGNGRHNAVADGNAFLFFAFVLVVLTLVRRGAGTWLQRVFFAACAANAAAYFGLIVLTTSGAVSLDSVRNWLSIRLAMGGVIGYMPNGDFRLFTAGSLFLVVGLVLTAQRLLVRPRDPLLWLLGAILTIDLIATYTRGLWLAGFVAVVLVLALEVRNARQLGFAVAIPCAAFGVALALAPPLLGFSLYSYVFSRAATITATGQPAYHGRVTNPSFETSMHGWSVNGPRSLHARPTASASQAGTQSLALSNTKADGDDYAFQNLAVKAKTNYEVSAWVNAQGLRLPAAGGRGLFVWDPQDRLVYTVQLTSRTKGWRRLSFTFPTRKHAGDIQLRLYAPQGRVLWDDVRLVSRGPATASSRATGPIQVISLPGSAATQSQALASTGAAAASAGEASNAYKVTEAKALWGYIKKRPLYGYGFGKEATDFGPGYTYELSYLDLMLKAGIIGLLLYLSFPLRLVFDALRLRRSSLTPAHGAGRVGTTGVVVGVIVGILVAGATNPYLFAAFGLVSILVMVAWLEQDVGPIEARPEESSSVARASR